MTTTAQQVLRARAATHDVAVRAARAIALASMRAIALTALLIASAAAAIPPATVPLNYAHRPDVRVFIVHVLSCWVAVGVRMGVRAMRLVTRRRRVREKPRIGEVGRSLLRACP